MGGQYPTGMYPLPSLSIGHGCSISHTLGGLGVRFRTAGKEGKGKGGHTLAAGKRPTKNWRRHSPVVAERRRSREEGGEGENLVRPCRRAVSHLRCSPLRSWETDSAGLVGSAAHEKASFNVVIDKIIKIIN